MDSDQKEQSPEDAQICLDREAMQLEHDEKASPEQIARLEKLLGSGANPAALTIPIWRHQPNGKKTSALVIAAGAGCENMVELFLRDESLGVNVVDDEGDHGLFAALKARKSPIAKLLLPRTNLALRDIRGNSCLWVAIRRELAAEAATIVERLSQDELLKEFEAMLDESLVGKSSASKTGLWKTVQGLLLSKIEAGVLAKTVSGTSSSGAPHPNRPRL